ncbi:MAG TPA: TetR family transcriptional regulator [Solirubrobacteraceae bacterium]|nr:TetR family transcriptional regulator [Solirubrobacteraceae bacterium]
MRIAAESHTAPGTHEGSRPAQDVDTRVRILRATLALIGRDGIAELSNRRIATEAGVALGSLTYHFPSQASLLRESLLLYVGEEVARLEAIADELRARSPHPGAEQIVAEVQRIVAETAGRPEQIAELELHLQAARDPALQEASGRCFAAYQALAAVALEALNVPNAARHARAVVALMTGMGLQRLGTGSHDASGVADALLTIIRGAHAEG